MLQAEEKIQSGQVYLVNYFGECRRVKALWPSAVPRGWWHCRLLATDQETLIPEQSFLRACDGESTRD
jgi:hypothetical protein